MANIKIQANNIWQQVLMSDHKNKPMQKDLEKDVKTFLEKNAEMVCDMVHLDMDGNGNKKVLRITGKICVYINEMNKHRKIGFKFILPDVYPQR